MELIYLDKNIHPGFIPCYKDFGPKYNGVGQHTHYQAEFIYIANGQLINTLENGTQILNPRQLTLIRAKDIHCTLPYNTTNYTSYCMCIPNIIIEKIFDLYNLDHELIISNSMPPVITLSHEEHISLIKTLNKIIAMPFSEERGQIVINLFSNIIYYISHSKNLKTSLEHTWPPFFEELVFTMSSPENFIPGLSQLKHFTNYSNEYISRCFKKYLNITPTEYINNLRLDYAVELLLNTDMNILDICFASGFKNEGHFYKLFKNRYDTSPYKFKKHNTISKNSLNQNQN